MIDFNQFDYVFQPIFYAGRDEIFAYEALMRPKGKTFLELIDEYTKNGKLHYIEVATYFGAVHEYLKRGYDFVVDSEE